MAARDAAAKEVRMKMRPVTGSLVVCALLLACGSFAGLQAAAEKKKSAPKVSPAARVVLENAISAMGGEAALAKTGRMRLHTKGFFNATATTEIYTLPLLDALPI